MRAARDITRAIIDTTVDRGLREVDEDPRRGIRKLTDLGRQFSKGRFVHEIYAMFQELLHNDDSPYYNAIEHILHHTNRKALKLLGINIGYSSLTLGAREIRSIKKKHGYDVPWSFLIKIDPKTKDHVTAEELSFIIGSGSDTGIYTYMIKIERNVSFLSELLPVFKKYRECAFFLVLPDEELPDDIAGALAARSNVFNCIYATGDTSDTNAFKLRRLRAWYGVLEKYNENSADLPLSDERIRRCMSMESAFLMLCAEKGTSYEKIVDNTSAVKRLRLEPKAPLIVFDLYGDAMGINLLATGEILLFTIDSDRTMVTNRGNFGKYEKGTDLKDVFKKIFGEEK